MVDLRVRGGPVAWNDIPAKSDPEFRLQAYYARLNILRQFLSPLSVQMFETAWESANTHQLRVTARCALVGEIAGSIIQGLALDEIADVEPPIGGWFVHSGTTRYRGPEGASIASIDLPSTGRLTGRIRRDCVVSNSAYGNMIHEDDVSFVLGRRIAANKFDLVVAGFREASMHLHGTDRRVSLTPGNAHEPDWSHSLLPHLLPRVEIRGVSNELTLAYAVKDTLNRFSQAIEKEGAWKILYGADGRVEHETRHQALFRTFAQLTFTALGIVIHPNADHGRGPTDLTLTLGTSVHIIEFKKDTDLSKVSHGLEVQLPLYMKSAGATYGSYVVMCHEREKGDLVELMAGKSDLHAVITTSVIDCRPKKSASKA
jgi:hypothetical protein